MDWRSTRRDSRLQNRSRNRRKQCTYVFLKNPQFIVGESCFTKTHCASWCTITAAQLLFESSSFEFNVQETLRCFRPGIMTASKLWGLGGVTDLFRSLPSCKRHNRDSAPLHGRPGQDQSQSWRIQFAGKATWLQMFTLWLPSVYIQWTSWGPCDDTKLRLSCVTLNHPHQNLLTFSPSDQRPAGKEGEGRSGDLLVSTLDALNNLTEEEKETVYHPWHRNHKSWLWAMFPRTLKTLATPVSCLSGFNPNRRQNISLHEQKSKCLFREGRKMFEELCCSTRLNTHYKKTDQPSEPECS